MHEDIKFLLREDLSIQRSVEEFMKREILSIPIEDRLRMEEPEIMIENGKVVHKHKFPSELYKKAAELDFIGPHYNMEFPASFSDNVDCIMHLAQDPIGLCLTLGPIPAQAVNGFGNEKQKQECLTGIVKGDYTFSIIVTEPNSGSDLSILATNARRTTDGYIVTGEKTFITNATVSKYGALLCNSENGPLMLIVDLNSPGITIRDLKYKAILPASPTCQVFFDEVRIPKENLIGEEGKGLEYVAKFLDESRVNIAAQAVGLAKGAFELAFEYAKQRLQGNVSIIEFEAIRQKLLEMKVDINVARRLTYYAAGLMDSGKLDGRVTSMAKYFAARTSVEVTRKACDIYGGYGHFYDNNIARFHRDSLILPTYEGTEEMQLNRISRDYGKNRNVLASFMNEDLTQGVKNELCRKAMERTKDSMAVFNLTFEDTLRKKQMQHQYVKHQLAQMETLALGSLLYTIYAGSASRDDHAKLANYNARTVNNKIKFIEKSINTFDPDFLDQELLIP
jgi:alkylation response protein AidB-like acyl-CoA dehydrogenase